MNRFFKKGPLAVSIALAIAFLAGWRLLIAVCSLIERIIPSWGLYDMIPFFLIGAVAGILFSLILWLKKKRAHFYKAFVVSLTLAFSCLYMLLSYDGYGMRAKYENFYFDSKNGKWGAFDAWGTELYPFVYDGYVWFHKSNAYGAGVLKKEDMYVVVNGKGNSYAAERLVSFDYNPALDKSRYGSQLYTQTTYGFVALIEDRFYLLDTGGELVIPSGFDAYVKDTYSCTTLWIKQGKKWGAYDIASAEQLVDFEYDDCQLAENGIILKRNNDIYFAQWDEENLLFYNLSQQQRENEQNQRNALLLLMLFNQMNTANSYQYSQINGIYQDCGVIGRSRDQIQRDIDHLKKLQREADGPGGIAESIGYARIQSGYDALIADRERELMLAH